MNDKQIQEVEKISKTIYAEYCHGNTKPWFDVLHKDCVWFGSGEPTLIGADKIKNYFGNYSIHIRTNPVIINDSFSTLQLDHSSYIVTGNVLVGTDPLTPTATVQMTMVYRYINKSPKLIYQHMSYDFIHSDIVRDLSQANSAKTDLVTRLLIRQTLLTKEHIPPISIKAGQQTYYISPASIIYLQSNGHKTNLYCIDKVVESSMPITEFAPILPDRFYFLRRGCIVNTMYITAIRRCEIELVFGTTLQVPAATFTTAKKEINELILRTKKQLND